MPTYATADDLQAYVTGNPAVTLPQDIDALLERAERRVDALVGPHDRDSTGRKFVVNELTTAQAAALSRATCAAAEHELLAGPSTIVGSDDFIYGTHDGNVSVLRRASRTPPKVLEELEGFGLLTYS